MPNHLHVITQGSRPGELAWQLSVELRAWTRRFFPGTRLWTPVGPPEPIPDERYLLRLIRYIHLNPCRAGLARDPLEWEWSTHRDLTGCVADPWPDPAAAARLFETSRARLAGQAHRYVSGDPTVAVAGTPAPWTPAPGEPIVAGPRHLLRAAGAVLRLEPEHRRSHALALAASARLKLPIEPRLYGVSRATSYRLLTKSVDLRTEDALRRILGDRRLMPTSQLRD
jgi:hypothetical protein